MEFLQEKLRVFVVPVEIMDIPDLDIYEQMVYIVLRSFTNPREATAFPSYSTIARLGRMSRRKAIDAVQCLVDKGLLKKEIRLDVSKNRKIKNTSNLYSMEPPKVVHDMHHPSAQDAPPLVHDMHHPSAQRAPEQNHLTKSPRTKSMNNNNKESLKPKESIKDIKEKDVVVDLLIQHKISFNKSTITKWRKFTNDETIIKTINETLTRSNIKNVIGYITKTLESGYTPSTRTVTENKKDTLPDYIIKQMKQEDLKIAPLSLDQKQEAESLLRQLDEIGKKRE